MACDDMNIAVFASPFEGGSVRLWYCPCEGQYALRYAVRLETGGVGQAVCMYDAGSYRHVADMLVDAVYIANLPLEYRD